MRKAKVIIVNAVPVVTMIGLIPFILNDYELALAYIAIAVIAFLVRRERHDFAAYLFGLFALTVSEYFFISTGVETFQRHSLLGIMPIWLPLLWAYAFVVIKRSVHALDHH
jgi:hypothetical protein